MAEYQLTAVDNVVIRTADNTAIPGDGNEDWVAYQQWLTNGGVPDPYVPPPPTPTQEQQVLFDHENRILAQEGLPPLSMADFVTKMSAPASAPAKTKRGK